ncbi:MAG: hypothetical protein ACRBBW_04635 [Cellvibrionaceae bacterium]
MTAVKPSTTAQSDSFGWTPVAMIFIAALAYAIARYGIFGPVPMSQWPTYILNKAIAVFAVATLALSAYNYLKARYRCSKAQGRLVWHAALIHSAMSLALLSEDYYPGFFSIKGMNGNGELAVVFGVLCTYALWQVSHHTGLNHHRFKRLVCALALLHLLPMSPNWIKLSSWHGSMPPLSLLSAVITLTALILYWRYRPTANN